MYITWLDLIIHCWQYWWCVASIRSLKSFMVLAIVCWNITVIKLREINWMRHIMRMFRLKYTRYLSEGLGKYGEWWFSLHLENFFRVCGIYSFESHINVSNSKGCISWERSYYRLMQMHLNFIGVLLLYYGPNKVVNCVVLCIVYV
jgi:hypothetical protein